MTVPNVSNFRIVSDSVGDILKWDNPKGFYAEDKIHTEVQIGERETAIVFGNCFALVSLKPNKNYLIRARHVISKEDDKPGRWAILKTRFMDRNKKLKNNSGFLKVSRPLFVQAKDLQPGDTAIVGGDHLDILENPKPLYRYTGYKDNLNSEFVLIKGKLFYIAFHSEKGYEMNVSKTVHITAKPNDLFFLVSESNK